jgi:hypothetical protein
MHEPRKAGQRPKGTQTGKRQGAKELSFFLLAHIALSAENKKLQTLREALYPKPARLLTVNAIIGLSKLKEALINGGSQLNLISKSLVTEQGLCTNPMLKLLVEEVNRSEIPVYSIITADITITNSCGRKQTHRIPFVVTDLQRY